MDLKTIFCLFLVDCAFGFGDYYWKEYDPEISTAVPKDAFVAGKGMRKVKVYVGQATVWPHAGVHPASIIPGKDVYFPYLGAKLADNFIQILCTTDSKKLKWVPTNSTSLHLVGMSTNMIRGGVDHDHITYVGRVMYQGNVIIGKIFTQNLDNAEMSFVYNNRENKVKSYEVLTYDDPEDNSEETTNNKLEEKKVTGGE